MDGVVIRLRKSNKRTDWLSEKPRFKSENCSFANKIVINANINGVGHNFIHNPFFRSPLLEPPLLGITQSIACCFSQTYYDVVHMQHHKGNSDRQDENGDTIDWLSIYRHGHDDEPENPWRYVFLSYLPRRSDGHCARAKQARTRRVTLGHIELAAFVTALVVMARLNWRYLVFFSCRSFTSDIASAI